MSNKEESSRIYFGFQSLDNLGKPKGYCLDIKTSQVESIVNTFVDAFKKKIKSDYDDNLYFMGEKVYKEKK